MTLLFGLLACSTAPRPDVVVITIDTLRADAVGGDPSATPTLDALAGTGWMATNASTMSGSKCEPRPSRMISRAVAWVIAGL